MTPATATAKAYWAALAAGGLFALLHFLTLPMVMTFDGGDYARLAAGWPRNFPGEWDFGRTPLYPLALRVSFWIFGRNPLGAMFPNIVFGLIGIWALAAAIRRTSPKLAIATVGVLTFFPTLIVYEHSVLTEAGSFMFLALLANWATWRPADPRRKTAALAAGIVAMFFFRPTSIALVPLAAVFLAFELRPRGKAVVAAHLLVVALVACVVSITWNRISAAAGGRDYQGQSIVFGVLKQVVLPPEDPLLAQVRTEYVAAIEASTVKGPLDNGGLHHEPHFPIYAALASHENPKQLLAYAVTTYPGRALAGFGRALMLNLGGATIDSENDTYFRGVVLEASAGSKLWFPTERLAPLLDVAAFQKPTGSRGAGLFVGAFRLPYQWLLWLGAVMTLAGFGYGCRYRHGELLVLTAIPLYWIVVHALTLMSSDRFVVPSHAFLVVNAVAVPALVYRSRTK